MQFSHLNNVEWKEFKRGVRQLWDLNETELEASGRSISKLENIIENKYNHESPEIIHELMSRLVDSFNNPTDQSKDGLYQTSFERKPFH